MLPAFQSTRAAAGFGFLLLLTLAVPALLPWIGLPPRDQAFSSVPVGGGRVQFMKRLIYQDAQASDIVFLGSSLIQTDVLPRRLARTISKEVHRSVRVQVLGLTWYGADLQYFMLKDYLANHPPPKLVVLHVPQVHATTNEPHPEAYRWMRLGEVPSLPARFPAFSKLQIYSEMVLGGPRQLLSRLRPNLIGEAEQMPSTPGAVPLAPDETGTTEADETNADPAPPPADLLSADSPAIRVQPVKLTGENRFALGPYTVFFLKQIEALVRAKGAKLVLLHLPLGMDKEPSSSSLPELTRWDSIFGPGIQMIGVPKAKLFRGLDSNDYYNVHDIHMNARGGRRFTDAISSAVAAAYLQALHSFPQGHV